MTFADDIVLIADNATDAKDILSHLKQNAEFKMNIQKNKFMTNPVISETSWLTVLKPRWFMSTNKLIMKYALEEVTNRGQIGLGAYGNGIRMTCLYH